MRTILTMCAALTMIGCGQGADDAGDDPKSRRNDVGPIERELRRTTGGSDDEAPSAPTARRETAARPPGDRQRTSRQAVARSAEAPARAVDAAPTGARSAPAGCPGTAAVATGRAGTIRARTGGDDALDGERAGDERAGEERAAASPASAAPGDAAAAEVLLTRVVVARVIEDREPVGAPPFASDLERVFLFVEAVNEGPAEATLAVEWIGPDGTRGRPIDLRVPVAPRWRTWATTSRVRGRAGAWTVVVRHAGRELARETFEVEASDHDELASADAAGTSADG